MNLSAFEELGHRVGQAWHEVHCDEAAFADIAYEAIADFTPGDIDFDAMGPFLLGTEIKQQTSPVFSDLPLTVYRGDGFYVELLVWIHNTTAIHQHSFSGAFRVLHGSSLHSDYQFDLRRRVNSRLLIGDINCRAMEHLAVGSAWRIRSGREGLIHSLYHLDEPSVTLVVRTERDSEAGPQLCLFRPGFAFHSEWAAEDERVCILNRWLATLMKTGCIERVLPVLPQLAAVDLPRIFGLVHAQPEIFLDRDVEPRWREQLSQRWGDELAAAMVERARDQRRIRSLCNLRAQFKDSDLRFFVALLLNGTRQNEIFDAIRARFPEREPAEFCVDSLLALAADEHLQSLQDSPPVMLGVGMALSLAGDQARPMLESVLGGRPVGPDTRGRERITDAERALRSLNELRPLLTPG